MNVPLEPARLGLSADEAIHAGSTATGFATFSATLPFCPPFTLAGFFFTVEGCNRPLLWDATRDAPLRCSRACFRLHRNRLFEIIFPGDAGYFFDNKRRGRQLRRLAWGGVDAAGVQHHRLKLAL